MTCGEEVIMFNERALEFEGGAFIPCRKGAQAKNRTKINERQRWYLYMIAVALGHCDKCTQRTHSTNADMEPKRWIKAGSGKADGGALAKPGANA